MKPVLGKRDLLVVRRLPRRGYASAPPAGLMVSG
jgi:hypothetical protein